MTRPDVAGLLLAGGASTRMGRDKRLLRWQGETLVTRSARTLMAVADPVSVLCDPDRSPLPPGFPEKVQVIPDEAPGSGPLAALAKPLGQSKADWVLVLAADYPLVDVHDLRTLKARALEESVADAVIPIAQRHHHVLCAAYRPTVGVVLQKALARGELSLRRALLEAELRIVAAAELIPGDVLLNMNAPEDWDRLLAAQASSRDRGISR